MNSCELPTLSIRIAAIVLIFFISIWIIDVFVIDSVPVVYDRNGDIIAKIDMTKEEVISNMGSPLLKDETLQSNSCFCYPVSFQNKIKTSIWRREMFGNYLKIAFQNKRVDEIYFFGWNLKGRICYAWPPLAIKMNKVPYK